MMKNYRVSPFFKIDRLNYYVIAILLWAMTIAIKFKYNGLVYGFDFGIYQPDGMHYTVRTLKYLGHSDLAAANMVADWYNSHSFKISGLVPEQLLPENSPAWALVKPRILYPILSIPFVAILGIPGMLVLPYLSFLVLLLLVAHLVKQSANRWSGVLLLTVLASSITVQRWMLINCTDSVLVGLFSLYLLLILHYKHSPRIVNLIDVAFVILTALTRFSVPFWIAIAVVLFLNRERMRSLIIAGTALLASLSTLSSGGSSSFLPAQAEHGILYKLVYLPYSTLKITVVEIAELLVLDKTLLFILIVAICLSLKHIRYFHSRIFLAMLFAGLVIGGINGTLGVNFRYQLPILPFMIFSLVSNARIFHKISTVKDL